MIKYVKLIHISIGSLVFTKLRMEENMSGKHKKKNGKSVNKKQNNKKICDQLIEVTLKVML